MRSDAQALQNMIRQIVETLQEELRQHQRLLRIVRRKKDTILRSAHHEIDSILRAETEVLTDMATVERDRIQLLAEVGEILGHVQPTRLRVAELVLHADPECRDELLDLREELRDLADELEDLGGVEPIFTRHRQENVRLYVTPARWKRGLNVGTDATAERRPASGRAIREPKSA